MRSKIFLIFLVAVIFALASGFGLRFVLAAWQEPTEAPPGGNVPAPINVGSTAQTKVGSLTIGSDLTVQGTGGNVCHQVGEDWYSCPGLLVTPDLQQVTDAGNETTHALIIDSDANETTSIGGNLTVSGISQLGLVGLNGSNLYFNQTTNPHFYVDSKRGIQFRLDFDQATAPDDATFQINNGDNVSILTLDEAGNLMVGGGATIVGNATVAGQNVCLENGTNCPIALGNYIWNTTERQPSSNFNISGNGVIGADLRVENDLSVVNNVNISGIEMNFLNAGSYFINGNGDVQIRIDANNDGNNLFKINNGANTTVMTVSEGGDVSATGCFGAVYVGQTAGTYDGSRGGYDDADALCAATIAGSHICRTSEILETIKCNLASLPTTGLAWISNGPPGFTARANDCRGWTSNVGSGAEIAYGPIWEFTADGGIGWVSTCNMTFKFACCK